MKLADLIRNLCPPALLSVAKRISGRSISFSEAYSSWAEAASHSSGYDDGAIVERVAAATRKVVSGEAKYERDSVLFGSMDHPFQVLAPLLKAALLSGGRLSVIDFGGSLGGMYRQCSPMLTGLEVQWNVVEQGRFVEAGRAEFETGVLRFFASMRHIGVNPAPSIALFSSVLQYLEDPYEVLDDVVVRNCRYLLIDRTPFHAGDGDEIRVQKVPKQIYEASYPVRIFGYQGFLQRMATHWSSVAEFGSPEGSLKAPGGTRVQFRGLVMERRTLG